MLTQVEAALPAVLSASISAAAMVLVIQAIVWLANARLSPRWCHALWLVVFVRLALPVLPEVPPSITPPKPTAHAVAEYISTLEATPLEMHTPMAQRPALEFQSMPEPPVAARIAPPPADAPPAPWNWKQIFGIIWIAVAMGMLGVMWVSSWCTVRRWHRLSEPVPAKVTQVFEDLCAELQIHKRPRVMLCPALAAPVLAGLWRPRILLPVVVAEQFSVEQLRHVLAHELGHLQRRDLWLHAGVAVLQSLHWFNPFAWYAARRVRAAAERCCDEWVLQRLSLKQGRDYADTLLRVLENPGRAWPLPGIAAMAESKADLTHRIRALAKWSALPRRWMFASASILAVLSFLALTVPGAEKRNSSDGKASPLPTAEITVTVLDAKKEPLANATVKMAGLRVTESPGSAYGWAKREGIPLSFTTGKDGRAAIKYPKKLEGGENVDSISFHVFADGQVPQAAEIPVNADPAPIQLEQAASLRVRALLSCRTRERWRPIS
jgi:bla regulator protein BlaR1